MTNTSTHRQSPQWFSRLHANGRPPLPQLLTQQALGTAYNGNGRLPLMPTISLFNNKGGVGKTTFLFHVAHVLADQGRSVLMVDCDSQCNLTAYALQDKAIEKAWEDGGNSIYRAIELVARGIGDIRNRAPSLLRSNLALIPGDLLLSDFEDLLGDSWRREAASQHYEHNQQSIEQFFSQQKKSRLKSCLSISDQTLERSTAQR